ncbi:SMC1 Structural maintenance of chromosomes protein 1 [Candida maltosa Xu316]
MATYEKENGDILKLKRTISVSGSSDYQINGKSVTMLNYSMVLKQENILIKARNFLVFQGDVEAIASQKPKDLTKLIENISGSNEFISEYEQLKEEKEKAHEATTSVFSRKRTLNSESKQYKEQMVEQRQFEEKIILKNDIVKKINLYKLYHNEMKHIQLKTEIKSKVEDLKKIQKSLSNKEKTYKSLMSEYSTSVLDLKKHQQNLESAQNDIDSTKRDLIPVEANKRSLSNKINSQKSKITDLAKDIKRQKQQVSSVERQLKEAEKMFHDFENKIAATSGSNSRISAGGQKEYEELRSKFLSGKGSELEEQISLLLNDKDSLKTTKSNLENQKSNAENRIAELESIISSELKSKLHDVSNEIKEILDKKSSKVDARNVLIKQKDDFNQQELQLNTKLRDVLVKLDELSSQQRESNKQKKLRENVATLKRMFPQGAIKGLVYELVRPTQQKYEPALATLLGRNFDSIIVETSAVAYKCIEMLKERRAGTATFIPLDSVEVDPINLSYLRSVYPSAIPGVDIVDYQDKSLQTAVDYIIGNTLVVDNTETARRLRWQSNVRFENKIVTLQGSVIHKSGLMTGGQQQTKASASLGWDKQEFTRLNEVKEDLSQQVFRLQEKRPKDLEINQLAEEIAALDDKLPVLRNQKSSIERIIKDRETEIEFQTGLLNGFDKSIEEKSNNMKKLDQKMDKVNQEIKSIKQDIFGDFCQKYGFVNGIEDYENMHGSTLRVRAKERAQYSKAISVLQNKLDFERGRCKETEERQGFVQRLISDLEEELSRVLLQKRKLEEKLDKAEAEYEVLQSENSRFENSIQTKLKSSKSVELDVNDTKSEATSVNKEITQMEENLLKIDSERANVLRNCKIQNINIPLDKGDLDTISVGENSENSIKEVYKIEIDYELLDEKYKAASNHRLEGELEVLLQDTISELEKLTPNAKAIERLHEVEAKLRSYDKDYNTARQKERQIVEKFKEVQDERYKKFMDAFNHISGRIDSIYKELTKSNVSPLGGSAFLNLEDPDTPFDYGIRFHAMPPSKRFREMELLSGGEKTMAALALLFAIHSYQPSPFFVLDEIDAALDNANVSRIGNYIKKYAGSNFQFIVISLKNSLFEKSDALVGIYREQRENSSKTVTLDLREYPDEDIPLGTIAAAT